MRLKTPRWLLFLEAALLSGALLGLAYKAAMRVHPLPVEAVHAADQARKSKVPDAQTQLMTYYRQYPERYIRIIEENWVHSAATNSALHFLKLRNIALVGYTAIEVSFTYESAGGKALLVKTAKVPVSLAAGETKDVKGIKVQGIPAGTKSVVTAIAKAQVVQ